MYRQHRRLIVGHCTPHLSLCLNVSELTSPFEASLFDVSMLSNAWVMALVKKLLSPAYQFQDQDEPYHFPRVYSAANIGKGQIPGRLQI